MNNTVPDWTEEELDEALMAVLDASLALDPPAMTVPWQPAATPPHRHRNRRRWVVMAAITAVLAFAAMLVPSLLPLGGQVQNTAAAATLTQAARNAMSSVDPAVGPGQYLQITTDDVHLLSSGTEAGTYITLIKGRLTRWIPHDVTDNWVRREIGFGATAILSGAAAAAAAGVTVDPAPVVYPDLVAPCGAFYGAGACTGDGSWQDPTMPWIDALPTDPSDMYDKLWSDTKGHGRDHSDEMLVYATDALKTGLIPKDKTAAIYLTLARVPGVSLLNGAATLDGRTGRAFTVTAAGFRHEMIIDPATGDYIGTREVQLFDEPEAGVTAGMTVRWSATTTTVVNTIPPS